MVLSVPILDTRESGVPSGTLYFVLLYEVVHINFCKNNANIKICYFSKNITIKNDVYICYYPIENKEKFVKKESRPYKLVRKSTSLIKIYGKFMEFVYKCTYKKLTLRKTLSIIMYVYIKNSTYIDNMYKNYLQLVEEYRKM